MIPSQLQIGNENLLTVCEPSQDEQLRECARTPGTRVYPLGDQQHLFDGSSTPMVEVVNARLRLRLVVARDAAGRYGLRAE